MTTVYRNRLIRIEWNGSRTFNVFDAYSGKNVDCFTVDGVPPTDSIAKKCASNWAVLNTWA